MSEHGAETDMVLLGASTIMLAVAPTQPYPRHPGLVRLDFGIFWHAVFFTERFARRFRDQERTWNASNDMYFAGRMTSDIAAFATSRGVAFQKDRPRDAHYDRLCPAPASSC